MNITRTFHIGRITGVLILLVVLVSFTAVSAQASPDEPPDESTADPAQASPAEEPSGDESAGGASDPSRLLEKAEDEGSVRAIVGLRTDFTPEGRLSRPEAEDQRDAIVSAGADLRDDLAGTGYETLREYETVPYIALELTPEALRALQDSPNATTVQEDVSVPAALAESSTKVQAPTMWEHNLTGGFQTIAVLDSGVDRFHPFLGGRVVEEACFSANSNCPNGKKTQTGANSAAPCTYAARGCRHGTHVAGIAAGQGSDFSGVARDANIMAVQVFSRFTGAECTNMGEDPCSRTFATDQLAGLERVYQLRNTRSFAAVNMSVGGGQFFSNCDTDARKAIIDNLKSAGIATVIASGNDGFTDSVNAPGCISSAVTVGNATKQDTLASDSNSAPNMIDLLAPGTGINSSVPGGGFASFSGTSMAAPHVAGAWALLEGKDPGQSVTNRLLDLYRTGTSVTDTRPGGTESVPRINMADAGLVRPPNDDFGSPRSLGNSVSTFSNGINGAATRELAEPDHLPNDSASWGENAVWYSWTAPHSGPVTMDTCTSSFDTVLAAYTGSALGSLSQVASDNDSCNTPNGSGSKLTFDAVAGTNYRIAVSGFEADTRGEGTFRLNVAHDPPPNDNFSGAQTISANSVNGTTVAATREFQEPDHYTTNPPDSDSLFGEHSVWYDWTAPSSGEAEMNTCQAGPIDSVLAVYTGSDLSTLTRVTDNRNGCPSGSYGSKVTFDATKGTTYRIAVANAVGTQENPFTLNVVDHTPPTVTSTTPAKSPRANVSATFSEAMEASSVTADTFTLTKKGTNKTIAASVTYDLATKTATLNPNARLVAGETYVATVTTGARDLAGNQLDQDPNAAGDQPKTWEFKVKK